MKKFFFALALASLICNFAIAQKKPALRRVNVSAATVASRSAARPYTLNLTRAGTVYNLPAGVDYNRVQVHTAKGDMTVAEVIKKSGKSVNGRAVIGMKSDLRAMRIGLNRPGGGRGLGFDCGGLACICTGDEDCNDLFSSTNCGPIAVCFPDEGICICLKF